MSDILPIPNDQALPVIRITIVVNAEQVGGELRPRWVIRDNGGDFETDGVTAAGDRPQDRELARGLVDAIARRRMSHYCSFGYAVEPWQVPS